MAGLDPKKAQSIYEFSAKYIDGNDVSFVMINRRQHTEIWCSGQPREVQGPCVCDSERGHQVRQDRRELQAAGGVVQQAL